MADTIQANSVVAIDYTLRGDDGEVIDSSEGRDPLHYLHGHQQIVPGLERELGGRSAGESLDVEIAPEDGYGARDEERVFDVPRERIPASLEPAPGMVLGMSGPGGGSMPVTVVAVSDEAVTLDANHSLAGQTLRFAVTIRSVRAATEEELSHGHVHGPGGAHG